MSNSAGSIPFWELGGISHEHYGAAVDKSVFYSGTQSGTLYSIDETISGLAGIYQKIGSNNYQGQRVRFSVKVKASNVERRCGIALCAGITACPLERALVESISGTQDWTDLSAVIDVPEYCVYITMGLLLVECGQIWCDDARLEIVGNDVATNSKTRPPFLKGKPTPADDLERSILSLYPQNMDFES